MANVFFDNPPILNGQEKQQLQQLYAYLNTMSEKLNQALMSISIEQMSPEIQVTIENAAGTQKQISGEKEALKSLIIKTAEIVRTEMDEIRTELHSEVEAVSTQYGNYTQQIDNQITATATGVLQQYSILERIQGLEGASSEFEHNFNSYIYMGILDQNTGKTGIAIGDGLTFEGGNIGNKMATFTDDRLSFYQNNVEVAYFSNSVFVIDNGEVRRTMRMGNHIWQVLADGSIALISDQTGV